MNIQGGSLDVAPTLMIPALKFYKIQNVQDALKFSGDVSNFVLYSWDDYGADLENQSIDSGNTELH